VIFDGDEEVNLHEGLALMWGNLAFIEGNAQIITYKIF